MDVLKPLGFEYITINPHSDSGGLQESIINYTGQSQTPELITCLHEEIAVAIAHGYFKIEGKPLAALIYSSVGLQHASMAVYSAFCDRVPVYLLLGNSVWNPNSRSARDPVGLARDFTKWDDQPVSLEQFAASAVRAYSVAMTPSADARGAHRRQDAAGKPDSKGHHAAGPEVHAEYGARRRVGRGVRGCAAAGERGVSGARCRACRAHRRGPAATSSSSPSCCRRPSSTRSSA